MENPIQKPTESTIEELPQNPPEELIEESIEKSIEEFKEELKDEPKEDSTEESVNKYKKIAIGIMIFLCTVLIVYFGMVKYYMNHFSFGTEINGINVSGKTVKDVEELMTSTLHTYTLNVKGLDGEIEEIKADEVGLQYISNKEFEKLKDMQNPYKWILAYFTKENSKMIAGLSYDEKQLRERIDKLSCFDSSNITEPKNPSFQYVNNSYVIVNEVLGYKIDKNIVYSHVTDAMLNGETEICLEPLGGYIYAQYNSKSEKIIEVKNALNQYVSSKITYAFGSRKEILDSSIINKWLIVDDNFEIIFDEKKARDYINGIFDIYDTIGKTREFVTSSGETIRIGGGDYGWSINETNEVEKLIEVIKEGKVMTIEPEYSQTAFSHGMNDIGDTYVEIDLEKQHIWFYKNGSLIVEGNVVTGNVKANNSTPKGIYRLKYKAKNVVLRGPGYASPVTFWMPFNGGIGIHDANWRSVFGGDIYLTNGSHGCINSPYNVAKEIFNNIEPGTPVVCY